VNALSRGGLVAGIAGIGLFIIMFLSWFGDSGLSAEIAEQARDAAQFFGVDPGQSRDTTESAWQTFGWFGVAVLLAAVIAAVSFAVVTYTGVSVSLPIALSSIATGFGAFAFVVVLYRAINPPGSGEVDREIGLYLGLLATAGIVVGGYLGMQDDDTSLS